MFNVDVIDKPYISLNNNVETQFILLSLQRESKYWIKKQGLARLIISKWNSIAGFLHSSFFYKKSKQAKVPTFVWLFCDDATTAKGPECDKGTNLRLRDFAVVQLMPTRGTPFVIFNFLENDDFFLNSVEYSEIFDSIA